MILLTDKENKFYKKQKVCYICKKGFNTDDDDNKKYQKVRDHCLTQEDLEELLILFVI